MDGKYSMNLHMMLFFTTIDQAHGRGAQNLGAGDYAIMIDHSGAIGGALCPA